MGKPAAASVSVDQLLHWRIGTERLEQLDQVGAIANLEERLADLIIAVNFFAMNLGEAPERLLSAWPASSPCLTAIAMWSTNRIPGTTFNSC